MRARRWFFLSLFCVCYGTAVSAEGPAVAAAANLTHPVTDIARRFQAETGILLRLNFGSSGDFARQIEQGAPYELFISADRSYVHKLAEQEFIFGDAVVIALGRIGAFIPVDSTLTGVTDLAGLTRRLSNLQYRRIAMANPEHAPFGQATQQVLQYGGIWAVEHDRVLLAENVAQAVQYTLAGGVDVGFIPYSFALLPEVAQRGRFLLIPASWHQPLEQSAVLLKSAGEQARLFFDYLQQPAATAVLETYGYSLPGRLPINSSREAAQGRKGRKSAAYTPVNEPFEAVSNATLDPPGDFQQTPGGP